MNRRTHTIPKALGAFGLATLVGATLAFSPDPTPASSEGDGEVAPNGEVTQTGQWHLRATDAKVVGGYGDNFAYDGSNVRPLDGHAEVRLNTATRQGEIVIELETTRQSGPIEWGKNQKWEGQIRIVQRLNTEQMDQARVMEEVWLHGDTGNEAPVMPKLWNYFATWGPSTIEVNGEEVVPMIGSHTMFSEVARGPNDRIAKGGQVYSPMVKDKTGFTNPRETEFHYVAHTTEQDPDNFPPHTAWIHLHFSDVEVMQKPSGVEIPYSAE